MRYYFLTLLPRMVVVSLMIAFAGCTWFKSTSDPEPTKQQAAPDDASWGRQYRSGDTNIQPTGLSRETQDIERSLGIE
jgi:hypothetical protein